MKNIVMGIIAHVDAGKTTLSEALLYTSGMTERLGRVDKRDAHLDTDTMERERGITIFSKQAEINYASTSITLIDTPGHTDFSCETERALSIQDYAVLVISATDGVRAHTKTLWQMLSARRIPTFIFVNKCDLSNRIRKELIEELRVNLSSRCVDFTADGSEGFLEEVAGCDERLMNEYFETDSLGCDSIAEAIRRRTVFPCFFGSALRLKGVRELLDGIDKYARATEYSSDIFGAKIYKIMRDKNGRRLTFAKITGGCLRPKDTIELSSPRGKVCEKVEELRIFSADRSKPIKEAPAGTVCAILGPVSTKAGMGLGIEPNDVSMLAPALQYRILLPGDVNPYETYMRLLEIGEEDPSLSLCYAPEHSEIRVSLMGEIQLEVLKRLIQDRLGISVGFDEGRILYRETVGETVRGAGHFEPLCHYAEVHLELSYQSEGGVTAASECDRDALAVNWQRLIMTHIEEREHRGRLIGAPLCNLRVTIIGGRAHQKHTEGGDFREATYRAIRQAIMKSEAVLLEPTFDFRIELPTENLGRALTDIGNMHGEVTNTEAGEDISVVEGICPVATMRGYPAILRAYTRGYGRIYMNVGGYLPCHNTDEVVAEYGYDPELDDSNPAGSIFCKGGAGYSVPWWEADEKMHVKLSSHGKEENIGDAIPPRARAVRYRGTAEEDKELMRIFEATYGAVKPRKVAERVENKAPAPYKKPRPKHQRGDEYVILDGYNVIHAWDRLRALAQMEFSMARDALIRIMCSYSAFKKCHVIIVFDAYRVKDGAGSTERIGNTTVVYTKERQTADEYIERATYEIAPSNYVRVVTSDMHEQFIILGNGALRVTPDEFLSEVEGASVEINEIIEKNRR